MKYDLTDNPLRATVESVAWLWKENITASITISGRCSGGPLNGTMQSQTWPSPPAGYVYDSQGDSAWTGQYHLDYAAGGPDPIRWLWVEE